MKQKIFLLLSDIPFSFSWGELGPLGVLGVEVMNASILTIIRLFRPKCFLRFLVACTTKHESQMKKFSMVNPTNSMTLSPITSNHHPLRYCRQRHYHTRHHYLKH